MVDKSQTEISALEALFRYAQVILCWFHVMQAVYRWLRGPTSPINKKEHAQERRGVVSFMRRVKSSVSERAFLDQWDELSEDIDPQVMAYLNEEWKPIGKKWAAFGRFVYIFEN